MNRNAIALAIASIFVSTVSNAESVNNEVDVTEEVRIIGTKSDAKVLPGSGSVVDEQQIETEVATDINQLLKTVPGIYIREEEGNGLRPNIGIRGATSERSEKINLMEDGVLIAPAPYSNPSAYYFPTTARMSSIEVLKGASLLRYGPHTTGGIVNMLSTPIPKENAGSITLTAGEHSSIDLHAAYGGKSGAFGWLLETVQRKSDGFKNIDNTDKDAGYDIEDYVVKLAWEGNGQSLLFKAQHSDEVSDETYLGLTDADYNANPNRRYGLSVIDQMDNDHQGYSLTYNNELSDKVSLGVIAYHNEFSRDWFKLSGGGKYISAANAGNIEAQGILDGVIDVEGLKYKHNNRSYESTGLDVNFDIDLGNHQIAVGARTHEDEMDRFQPEEYYNQVNGSLVFDSIKSPTGSNNRLEKAEALSLWLTDQWQVAEDLNLNLALRYEDVDSERLQFDDAARTELGSERSNNSNELLPGVSFTYDVNSNWQVLAGVHKGFSPLGGGAKEFEEPETSVNFEAGIRYSQDQYFVEAIGFHSDFDNKTENCSNASPCSNDATSGTFITGEATIAGLELQFGTVFDIANLSVPVDVAYTYTSAELSKDNVLEGFTNGDELAAIPENTFSARVGIEGNSGWNNYLVAKYIDEMCVDIGCNRSDSQLDRTESLFVVDYISRYVIKDDLNVFLKVENFFDKQSIVSREPDGARPNKPRTFSVGLTIDF